MIYYDRNTRCYRDDQGNFVHASSIRYYQVTRMGINKFVGRLSRKAIESYWLDVLKISDKAL